MVLDILDGNTEDQKKQRFYRKMTALDGRTFEFDGVSYMVRSGINNDDQPAFYLEIVPEKKKKKANA
jgi:hypothetical protein